MLHVAVVPLFLALIRLSVQEGPQCHQCDWVRSDEAQCNANIVQCRDHEVCRSRVMVDNRNRLTFFKKCIPASKCSFLDTVFCVEGSCYKCCTEGNLCNADTSDVIQLLQEDECESVPCLNGGSCQDQVNGFSCVCAEGYSGNTCEIDIDDCAPNPCQNGGGCTDQVNGFSCACLAGYAGETCETALICQRTVSRQYSFTTTFTTTTACGLWGWSRCTRLNYRIAYNTGYTNEPVCCDPSLSLVNGACVIP